jgi:pimeloyl-ACP methyl ester carboxylesterase
MAIDGVGLMDHLGWESAHVVGASMGGMIAQTMAIEHPERLRSLVSIMSTTGQRWTGLPTVKAFGVLFSKRPTDREAFIQRGVNTFRVIGSPGYPFDEQHVREVASRSYDRGQSAAGVARQLHAITASGDRTTGLEGVHLPATVIHGNRDPLVRPSGGRATAAAISGSRLKIIDGMGHDLPRELYPTLADEIESTAARAEGGVTV